ncbi:hypothetical protein MTO96_022665 [Rhipicephalus appendiculatus]
MRSYVTMPEPGSIREFRDCGGNLTAFSQPTVIYSPGYPMNYDPDRLCRWVITAVQGSVTLRFVDVQIEESPDCGFDSVGVLPGPGQGSAVKLCGNMTNHTIATNSSTVTVVFRSDDSYEERIPFGILRRRLTQQVIDFRVCCKAGLPDECGDRLVGEKGAGIVTSPGYPLQYPHSSSCWTLINVDPGRVIVIRLKDLDTGGGRTVHLSTTSRSSTARQKILHRSDGSARTPSNGRSGLRPAASWSTSKSDEVTSSRGFLLEYKSDSVGIKVSQVGGCTVTSGFENGTLASPGYPNKYPAAARCQIDLKAPRETKVALKFVDFSVEPEAQCNYDFVEIWDGQQDGWRSLGRLCGDKEKIAELVSSENRMRLKVPRRQVHRGARLRGQVPPGLPARQTASGGRQHHSHAQHDPGPGCAEPLPDLYLVPPSTLWVRRMHSNLTGSYTCRVTTKHLEATSTSVVFMEGTMASDNCSIHFQKSPEDQELHQGETMVMHLRRAGVAAACVGRQNSVAAQRPAIPNQQPIPGSRQRAGLRQRCQAQGHRRLHLRGH